jgi:galactonate dehydratase
MVVTEVNMIGVHVNHRGDWVFVQIHTDAGIHGLGELRAGKNYDLRLRRVNELAGLLIGKDPRNIRKFFTDALASGKDIDSMLAISALEQALWDISGKALGVPVHSLLGGRCRDEIRLYANINRASTDRSPGRFAQLAKAAVSDGFDAVKLAPFDGMPSGIDNAKDAHAGIECMEAVREAVGAKVDVLIDCHSHFTPRGALSLADALRDLDLYWFEQPIQEDNLTDMIEANRSCGLRTAGGEQRRLRQGFTELMGTSAMDIIMPDVTIVGGIGELVRVAEMAEAWGIPTAPHGPFGPITIASGVQAMAGQPGFLILEYGYGEVPWRRELTLPQEEIAHGRIHLTDRPGLGFELNWDVVEKHRVELV